MKVYRGQERRTHDPVTFITNGYVVNRNEKVTVNMGLLDDLMSLIGDNKSFKQYNSITTPDCFVELAAIVMKANE